MIQESEQAPTQSRSPNINTTYRTTAREINLQSNLASHQRKPLFSFTYIQSFGKGYRCRRPGTTMSSTLFFSATRANATSYFSSSGPDISLSQ